MSRAIVKERTMSKKKATVGERIVGDRIAHILKAAESAKGTIDRMNSGNYMHHTAQAKSQIDYMLRLLIDPKWLDSLAGGFNRKHTAAIKRAVREAWDKGHQHALNMRPELRESIRESLEQKYGVNL